MEHHGFEFRSRHTGEPTWLGSWPGIGHGAVGMARQTYDIQLRRYDERGGRAAVYMTAMEHSPTGESCSRFGFFECNMNISSA